MNPFTGQHRLPVLPWTLLDATGISSRRAAWVAACGRLTRRHTSDVAWARLQFEVVTWGGAGANETSHAFSPTNGITMILFPSASTATKPVSDTLCRCLVQSLCFASSVSAGTRLVILAGPLQLFPMLTQAGVHACIAEPENVASLAPLISRYLQRVKHCGQ
ncbi:MAG: hypothetical protein AAGD07_08380 [Planctomycetota bacterium]